MTKRFRFPHHPRAGARALGAASLALLGGLVLAACGGSSDTSNTASAAGPASGGGDAQLALVAYSTPKKAYDALTQAYAQTSHGKGVSFNPFFVASGAS